MQPVHNLITRKWLIIGIVLFIVSLLITAIFVQSSFNKPQNQTKAPFIIEKGAEYIPDTLIVSFQPGITPENLKNNPENAKLKASLDKAGVISFRKLFNNDDKILYKFYILYFKEGTDLQKTGDLINKINEVESVEVDLVMKAFTVPDDPSYSQQWDMKKIGMEEAWDKFKGSKSVIVAVVDTGIDYNHPDIPEDLIKGKDFINNDDDPKDDNGHGTHVAGTIGAATNNNLGVAGINWEIKLMAVKVLAAGGSSAGSSVSKGIIYSSDSGAKVINMSLGGYGSCSSSYQSAIDYAINKGVTVVVAAGNDRIDARNVTPASCKGVITVGATDSSDKSTSFTNYGPRVDLGAPGLYILSTWGQGSNGYNTISGTSMASPHVAGVAGLIISTNPSLTPQQVRDCLVNSGDPITTTLLIGGKRLNASKALDLCGNLNGPTSTPGPTETTVPTQTPTPIVTGPTTTLTPSPSVTPSLTPTAPVTPSVNPSAKPTSRPTPTTDPRKPILIRFKCFVFRDLNNNGTSDSGEPGLKGAEFSVFPKRVYSPTALTSKDGYCYLVLIPGSYKIIVRFEGKTLAISDPITIKSDQLQQTVSIGIPNEILTPKPTQKVPYQSYECKQPTTDQRNALQMVNLICTQK